MFVAGLRSDKRDEFLGLEGLYVQLAALTSTHNTTVSRGLDLFSVYRFLFLCLSPSRSLTFCVCFCVCVCVSLSSYDVH